MTAINAPGAYEVPADIYHADSFLPSPSLSSGVGKLLITRSPRHAWAAHPRLNPAYKQANKAAFDVGRAAHHLILGDPGRYKIIDAADYRTKAAQEQRAAAYDDGLIPLLTAQQELIGVMASACREQLRHHEAADALTDGKPEQTIVWQEGDIWCRCRPDWLHDDAPIMDDVKTTAGSAEPDAFIRRAYDLGYDFQDAFYRRGYRAVFGADPKFRFIVVENEAPHALSVVEFDDHARRLADQKVERSIAIWRHCLTAEAWPGYPARVASARVPAWHEMQWDERVERENATGGVREYMDKHALHWKPIEPKEAAE